MEVLVPSPTTRPRLAVRWGFHLQMASATLAILVLDIVGCLATRVQVPDLGAKLVALILTMAALLPLSLYWNEKKNVKMREACLTIVWGLLLWALLPFPQDIAARYGMWLNLQDSLFIRMDDLFGVNVPGVMSWASRHWVGGLINKTYEWLAPFLAISFLLAALTGKIKQARQFLTVNLVAFAIGTVTFALLPAVGPWYGYHFPPTAVQAVCQSDVFQIRSSAVFIHHPAGIVCFPSFHVVWAIFAAQTIWVFRPLRIPAAVLSGLIIVSTMTTGWHYFSDVLGGILVALIATFAAEFLGRRSGNGTAGD